MLFAIRGTIKQPSNMKKQRTYNPKTKEVNKRKEINMLIAKLCNKSTCILEGVRTSKAADALKENVVNGLDNVVEFTTVSVFESIS